MNRRKFLGAMGLVGVSAIASCGGGGSGDGSNGGSGGGSNSETVVDKTVYEGDIKRFNFEVEEGQTIEVYINNIEGARTTVVLTDAEDEPTETFEAETESTGTHEASMTGVYAVNITTLGEAEVRVSLE